MEQENGENLTSSTYITDVSLKTLSELIDLMFTNIKDITDNIDLVSTRTLLSLSLEHGELITSSGLNQLKTILDSSTDEKSFQQDTDTIETIVNLFKELIEKSFSSIPSQSYHSMIQFTISYIQPITANSKSYNNYAMKKVKILSNLLISIASVDFTSVFDQLMTLFLPGVVPHEILFDLFNKLSISYPSNAAGCYQSVISRSLPLLSTISNESTRVFLCKMFSQVCESIIIAIENKQSNCNYEALSHLFSTAYEMIIVTWLKDAKTPNAIISITSCLIMLGTLLPLQSRTNKVEEIAMLFVSHLKRDQNIDNATISKSYRIFLEFNIDILRDRICIITDSLLLSISPILSDPNISPNVIKYSEEFIIFKSEIFKIFLILFSKFIDKTLPFLVNRFESIALIDKMSTVYILKTMLIRIDSLKDNHRDMLCIALSKATHETDHELKSALFDLIYCLFEKRFITDQSASKLISFLIDENGYSDNDIEADAIIQAKKSYPFYTTLKFVCDKAEMVAIDLITKLSNTTIPYFWPNVLEYYTEKKYDRCLLIVCKLINAIKEQLTKQGKEEMFVIDYTKHSSLPSQSRIMVKIMIALADPGMRGALISECFKFIKNVTPILFKDCSQVYIDTSEAEIYLKRCRYLDYEKYHELLIRLWDKILMEMRSGDDINSIIIAIGDYLGVYKNVPFIVGLLMRMQGVLLSKVNKSQFIKSQLDSLFTLVHCDYSNEVVNMNIVSLSPCKELRIGLGEAFGLASRNGNMDIVLDKINGILKSQIDPKRSSGLVSYFSYSKTPELSPDIVTSIIFAIGSIAKYATAKDLPNRINSNFLSHIDSYFKTATTKETIMLKYACLIAYGNLFKTLEQLSSLHIDKGDIFYLSKRNDYLDIITKIIRSEKEISEIKIAAMNNASFLINLDPPISQEQCRSYISLSLSLVDIPYPNELYKDKTMSSMINVLESVLSHDLHTSASNEKISVTIDSFTIIDFEYMVNYDKEAMTQWDYFSFILEKMVERYLRPNTQNASLIEKNANARNCIVETIQEVINSKKSVICDQMKEEFDNWAAAIVSLMVIAFDENNTDSQGILVSITRVLTGVGIFDVRCDSNEVFIEDICNALKEKLDKENYLTIFKMSFNLFKKGIASVNKMGSIFLTTMVSTAQDYFSEFSPSTSPSQTENGLSDSMNIMIPIIEQLIQTLEFIIKEESVSSENCLNLLKISEVIAKLNLSSIIDCCLQNNPSGAFSVSLSCIIESICNDKGLISRVFTKITDIINNSDPGYGEKPNFQVCRSTVILGTMLSTHSPSITPLIKKFIPQLLSTLLLRIGSAQSINYSSDQFKLKEEDPRNQSIWALQQLMTYFDQVELSSCLESNGSIAQKLLSSSEYDEGIYEFMVIFCKFYDYEHQSAMYEFLSGFIERSWNGQRITVATCYAQFVNYASIIYIHNPEVNINDWRGNLIDDLSKMLMDNDENCRKMAIRGLGNLCKVYLTCTVEIDNYIMVTMGKNVNEINDSLRNETKQKIKEEMLQTTLNASIVTFIIEKMSDRVESVILESLNSLQQMIEFLSIEVVIPCIHNLLIKLRPCFDNPNANIRTLGFNVFSRLIALVGQANTSSSLALGYEDRLEEIIKEQIHLHLVSLILHANDESPSVQNVCVKAMTKALIVIINEDVTVQLNEIRSKYNDYGRVYEDYVGMFSRRLVKECPNKINIHISNSIGHSLSSQDSIRGASAYLIGVMYKDLKELYANSQYLAGISLDGIFANFTKLLKDCRPNVKIQVMKAIGMLKDIKVKK